MKKIMIFLVLFMAIQLGYSQNNQTGENARAQKEQDSKTKTEEKSRHELSGWIGGGFSSLQYTPSVGKHKDGYGGNIGFGYTYLFKSNWGFVTGLELGLYNAQTTINNHSDRYAVIDDEEQYNKLVLMADIDQFNEKQQAYFLNIPLMLQYQGNGDDKFYAALGGKLGIPVQCKYKSTGDYLTKGKYEFTQDVFENMPEHGSNFYDGLKADEKLKLNLNFQLSGEAGYKWRLNDDCYLYTGIYCDYGLNDIRKTKNSPLNVLQYNRENPIKYTINSIAGSHYTNDKGTFNYTKKMNTLSFGIKLKVAFKVGE